MNEQKHGTGPQGAAKQIGAIWCTHTSVPSPAMKNEWSSKWVKAPTQGGEGQWRSLNWLLMQAIYCVRVATPQTNSTHVTHTHDPGPTGSIPSRTTAQAAHCLQQGWWVQRDTAYFFLPERLPCPFLGGALPRRRNWPSFCFFRSASRFTKSGSCLPLMRSG